ncbi:MAG: hypothetical protein LBJ11_02020 [Oscillospiraceae bacterium]|jgi:hypothetical protein|nr:hypothetical protein [Oscillospiraceae bacterium]
MLWLFIVGVIVAFIFLIAVLNSLQKSEYKDMWWQILGFVLGVCAILGGIFSEEIKGLLVTRPGKPNTSTASTTLLTSSATNAPTTQREFTDWLQVKPTVGGGCYIVDGSYSSEIDFYPAYENYAIFDLRGRFSLLTVEIGHVTASRSGLSDDTDGLLHIYLDDKESETIILVGVGDRIKTYSINLKGATSLKLVCDGDSHGFYKETCFEFTHGVFS